MIKAELDALALITDVVHTHQKCPNVQKKMDNEMLESRKELEEAKSKMENDPVEMAKVKITCEQQLRKKVDLEQKINAMGAQKHESTESSEELQNTTQLTQRIAALEEFCKGHEAMVARLVDVSTQCVKLENDNEQLKKDNADLKKDNADVKKDNEDLKKNNEDLKNDVALLKNDNEEFKKTNQRLTDDVGKLKGENGESKEILQNLLKDFESVQSHLRKMYAK